MCQQDARDDGRNRRLLCDSGPKAFAPHPDPRNHRQDTHGARNFQKNLSSIQQVRLAVFEVGIGQNAVLRSGTIIGNTR